MLAESDPSLRRLTPDVLGQNGIFLVYRRETLLVEPVRTVIDFVVRLMRDNAALVRGVPRR